MRLFYSLASPFVRRVMVTALELGIEDRIEKVEITTTPVNPDPKLKDANPIRKIPALETDDGLLLYDSSVITEYLDVLGGARLLPASGNPRWTVKRQEALGAGLLDAAVLVRYETFIRPEHKRWDGWIDAQIGKIDGALAQMNEDVAGFDEAATLGQIAYGCACGYLDFRFAEMGWRDDHPALATWYETFAKRPSMTATSPI